MSRPAIIHEEDQVCSEGFDDTSYGILKWKTLISNPITQSAKLTSGVAECPPKNGHLCKHRHAQDEIYYIIEGIGEMSIDGEKSQVKKGSAIYIPGNSEHGISNIGEDTLKWFYVFPSDSFGDIKYEFS